MLYHAVSEGESFDVVNAADRVFADYSDRIFVKPKVLHKFGRTTSANNGVKTTVATFQSTIVNETFSTGNSIDALASGSSLDVGIVSVEGHYFDADLNLVFSVQDVQMTGKTSAPLNPTLARATRLFPPKQTIASPAVSLTGPVYVYDTVASGGLSSGVPVNAAASKLVVGAGKNQSEKCATALSGIDYWLVTSCYAALNRAVGSGVNADVEIEFRQLGGVWLPLGVEMQLRTAADHQSFHAFDPCLIVPKNSDVRMVAISDTDNSVVSGYIRGHLALVRNIPA